MVKTFAIEVQGTVQGVGFRPFVYHLAQELNLHGWVNNSSQGATVVITASNLAVTNFAEKLQTELPRPGLIEQLIIQTLPLENFPDFQIRPSSNGQKTTTILPDLSTCNACLAELFDPGDRRHLYPFINCTHCGPRYSIIQSLPYDRPRTTMAKFTMCENCQREYDRPDNRRFHAQPNACPQCGPQLTFCHSSGEIITQGQDALNITIDFLKVGKIIAIKGLGGFHLCCDATNFQAVQTLRERKHRPHKSLAVMYANLDQIEVDYQPNKLEINLLQSPAAPIILLQRQSQSLLAENIAPNNKEIGVMLPYTPLHYLLLKEFDKPLVTTSGNLAGEPICIDNQEALITLNTIADGFLVHNRPIVCAVDDSVVRVVADQPLFLRRARGYAPLSISLAQPVPKPLLAVGGHYKNTVAIANQDRAYVSQHLGDLDSPLTYQAFQKAVDHLSQLYEFTPQEIIGDRHPDYLSRQYAYGQSLPVTEVQHHYAHILAVMAEHHIVDEPVLGVAWDGTGYGLDDTIWGGEFLKITPSYWQRIGHFKTFSLLGNQQAIKDPRRIALALLWSTFGEDLPDNLVDHFSPLNIQLLQQIWQKNISPMTSSVGRLFDGIAALIKLIEQVTFEGQGAMILESQAVPRLTTEVYSLSLEIKANVTEIDWRPLVREIIIDFNQNKHNICLIATKFHNTLVKNVVTMAEQQAIEKVVLGGGCFQNRYLLEQSIQGLRKAGFCPLWPQKFPPNDGGLCLGQLLAKIQPRQYLDPPNQQI